MNEIIVIGGGLAGVEAAWQAAQTGARVLLYEMRPRKRTPAHRTDRLAEIVCSNSLKSDEPGTASYLLKEELRRGGSLVLEAATATRVPAGAALAVDREQFAEFITQRIALHPHIEIVREEVTTIPRHSIAVIATGPLTSDALTTEIMRLTGDDQLYFYDAIAPIVRRHVPTARHHDQGSVWTITSAISGRERRIRSSTRLARACASWSSLCGSSPSPVHCLR